MEKIKKLKPLKWWIAGVVCVAALSYAVVVPRPVTVQTARVERGTFEESIQTDGIVRSKERYTVTAFAIGDIKRVSLKIGDPVKKGELITELAWDAEYRPVRAPINGVISKVYRESAGPIQRGEPIVEIIDPNRLEVVASLLTTDAIRVKSGDPVRIEGSGGTTAFDAEVIRVSKAGFTKQSALGVEEERTEVIMEPKNRLDKTLERFGNNFHVDMTIRTALEKNTLKIPIGAVFRDGAEWAVYRAENNRARKARIQILKRSSNEIMLGSGLNEGDAVIIYPGDLVTDGARIKIAH